MNVEDAVRRKVNTASVAGAVMKKQERGFQLFPPEVRVFYSYLRRYASFDT